MIAELSRELLSCRDPRYPAEVGLAASLVAEATPLASRCFGCGCRAVSVLDVVDGRIFGKPSGWRPDGGEGILRPSWLEDAGDHHVDRPVGGLDLPVVPLIQVMGYVPGKQLREIPHLGISERSASVGCHPNMMSAVSRAVTGVGPALWPHDHSSPDAITDHSGQWMGLPRAPPSLVSVNRPSQRVLRRQRGGVPAFV
jgi:hypothetical protein